MSIEQVNINRAKLGLSPIQGSKFNTTFNATTTKTASPSFGVDNRLSGLAERMKNNPIQTQTEQPKEGLIKTFGKGLISSEKVAAESLVTGAIAGKGLSSSILRGAGNIISLGGASKAKQEIQQAEESQKGLDDLTAKLVQTIRLEKQKGNDTSKLENLYKQNTGRVFNLSDITGGAIDKTTGQVLGAFGGVALDVLTSGTYGAAAKTAKTGQLLTKSPLLAKGAEAIGIGVTKPLAKKAVAPTIVEKALTRTAKSMGAGAGMMYGYGVANKFQEGKTGIDAFKPGWETALGAVLPIGIMAGGKVISATKRAIIPTTEQIIQKADNLFLKATDTTAQGAKRKTLKKTGDEIATIIREEQIPLGTQVGTKSVKIDANIAKPVIRQRSSLIDETIDKSLATNQTKQFSLKKLENDTYNKIDKFIKDSTDNKVAKVKVSERIKNVIDDPRYGQKITNNKGEAIDAFFNGQELRSLRSGWGQSKATKWNDPADYGALNQMYFSANDLIEKAYPNAIIRDLNKHYTRLIALQEALNPLNAGSLHGKVISGGGLGKIITEAVSRTTGGAIGGTLGSPFGFGGVAAGATIGQGIGAKIAGKFTNRSLSPARLSQQAIKLLKKKGILTKTEELVNKANQSLSRYQPIATANKTIPINDIKLLKNPKIYYPPSISTIQLPSQGILEGQRKLSELNKPFLPPTKSGIVKGTTPFMPPKKATPAVDKPVAKATQVKAADKITKSIKKAKGSGQSFDEWVNNIIKNKDKIPTTPEYQKYLKEQDTFVKRENEIYDEMRAMRDKYSEKTIEDVPTSDITKYKNLQKELNQTLSKKTLAKSPEGVIKTHIGDKALKEQLKVEWLKTK